MNNVSRILAIGAHPDDIELGLGGSLAKYIEEGKEVYALILSRGEKGVRDEQIDIKLEKDRNELKGKIREEETRRALNFIGVKNENIKVIGLPDLGIRLDYQTIAEVSKCVAEVRPDVVFTHCIDDDHIDHFVTSLISLHVGRRVRGILFYESPSTRNSFSPNFFVCIDKYLQKKTEALSMHKTQKGKPYMEEEVIKTKAMFRGFQAGVKYAEGFIVYRWLE